MLFTRILVRDRFHDAVWAILLTLEKVMSADNSSSQNRRSRGQESGFVRTTGNDNVEDS
jgi:hypothetical protein